MNARPRLRCKLALVALALSTLMSGCAVSPLVSWTPPTYPTDGAVSMNYAMRYARSARDAYRARFQDQVQNQGQLSAALLGIGALATGAAVARMHRDVFAGLAFAGGTSYAYGQQNLRPERLRVYVAGIEAMDCAIAVVSPLDMSDTDAATLRDGTQVLTDAIAVQDGAMAKLRVIISTAAAGPDVNAWNDQLTASAAMQTAAQATANSGREVGGKVKLAALALINSVDRVRTEMDKAAVETLPSLDAIGQAIASLPDLTARILPGANLDQRIRNAVSATSAATGTAQADVEDASVSTATQAANRASANLVKANRTLAGAAARVNALLASVVPTTGTAALSQCKVAGVVAPLSVTKTELRFAGSKDETLSFVVRGGVPPYTASLMTGGSTGVTVRNPAGNDTRIDVTVAASVSSGTFDLLVEDRANGSPNSASVAIQVGGTSTPTGGTGGGTAGAPTLDSFATAIGKVQPFTTTAGHRYTFISNQTTADGGLTTQLKCEPKTGQGPETEAGVRDALVKSANQVDAYKTLFAADGKKFKLTAAPTTCMTPAP